ncbi:MAG: hypothetical protein V7721_03145 [Porticoccaceae bacterium]
MNKDEAFRRFIKENFKFLTSLDLNKKTLKTKTKRFFITQHNKKFGLPTNSNLCEYLVKYQIKNGVPNQTLIDQIDILPIFKDVASRKLLSIINDDHISILTDEEMGRIEKTAAYESIKNLESEKLKKDIQTENKSLIDQRNKLDLSIKEKEEALAVIPSILDEEIISEPEFNPDIEDLKSWWERFYLKENPFPGNKDGLSKIDESLYEQIVVKTKPYRSLLSRIEKSDASIFDTAYMLVGDFGYGKTTFQDYLSYYLANINILPIRITCLRSQPDCNGYFDYFSLKLENELKKELPQSVNLDKSNPDIIIELSKEVCRGRKGIVIFLDDYHKHKAEFDSVYDFLGNLQLLKNELTRSNCNVGFIVSAIPKWLNDMPAHQQMSGFFDSAPIIMPDPTPEFIQNVFNKRISAYCYDTSPRSIELNFIEEIFKQDKDLFNYRDYLNRIIEELENNNMSIVSSPIEISDETLSAMEGLFKNNSNIWSPLSALLFQSRFKRFNAGQIDKCLELLVIIFTQNGINEREPIFIENKFYILRLKETGLITKRKNSSVPNGFSWVITKSLQSVADEIAKKYGYNLSDYFFKLFANKIQIQKQSASTTDQPDTISRFKRFLQDRENDIPEAFELSINQALVLYDKFDVDPSSKIKCNQAVEDMKTAIIQLGNATFGIDGTQPYFLNNGITDTKHQWELHHIDDELISRFFLKYDDFTQEQNATRYSVSNRAAKDAFLFLIENLQDTILDIVSDSPDRFGYKNIQTKLNPGDVKLYESIKNNLFSTNKDTYFRSINGLTVHLEDTFRDFLFSSCILAFGQTRYFDHVPGKSDAKYAKKNTASYKNMSNTNNLFAGLTRPQFRQIFTQGSLIKSLIIRNLKLPWTPEHWDLFFDIFIEENINTSHNKKDSFSSQKRNRYITYCRLASELVGSMNNFISGLIIENSYLYSDSHGNDISEYFFRTGYALKSGINERQPMHASSDSFLSKENDLEVHVIDTNIYERVKSLSLSRIQSGIDVQNLLHIDFIENHYGVKYSEYIYSLSFMNYVEKCIKISQWTGSRILIQLA